MSENKDNKSSLITGLLAGLGFAGGSFLLKKFLNRNKDRDEFEEFDDDDD